MFYILCFVALSIVTAIVYTKQRSALAVNPTLTELVTALMLVKVAKYGNPLVASPEHFDDSSELHVTVSHLSFTQRELLIACDTAREQVFGTTRVDLCKYWLGNRKFTIANGSVFELDTNNKQYRPLTCQLSNPEVLIQNANGHR